MTRGSGTGAIISNIFVKGADDYSRELINRGNAIIQENTVVVLHTTSLGLLWYFGCPVAI